MPRHGLTPGVFEQLHYLMEWTTVCNLYAEPEAMKELRIHNDWSWNTQGLFQKTITLTPCSTMTTSTGRPCVPEMLKSL